MIPTSLDELVRDSRDRIAKLRKQFDDQQDFEHLIVELIKDALLEQGRDEATINYVLSAMLGEPRQVRKRTLHA